jgi:CheY-like chemotaxis protein
VTSVLIVDDSLVIRRLLRSELTESEWIVCQEAENGRDGVAMAQEFRPDVVILDLAMPGMFTTHVVPGLEKEAIASGFREVISKSDGPPAVIKAIRTLLAA